MATASRVDMATKQVQVLVASQVQCSVDVALAAETMVEWEWCV